MANIDNVQLPDGSSYNIVDNTSGFATQNYVDSAVSSVTKTTIGLGNVDNTSDLNKPISTATQAALDTLDEDKADKTDIAPVESSSTASQTYQIDEQFYYNGLLYKATAVINSGGTITPNGNCSLADSIVKQLGGFKIKTVSGTTIAQLNTVIENLSDDEKDFAVITVNNGLRLRRNLSAGYSMISMGSSTISEYYIANQKLYQRSHSYGTSTATNTEVTVTSFTVKYPQLM